MSVLVLGGTRFIGRHIVAEFLSRGDDVTLLFRGHSPSPFAGVAHHIVTDRRAPDADARRVLARDWDAVIDTSGTDVDDLRAVLPLLGEVAVYIFVSTCGVYRRDGTRSILSERSPTIRAAPSDPAKASATRKLRAERHLRRHFGRRPTRLVIARLGLVIGPYDYSGRFAYWLERAIRGGDILVPMQPEQPLQLIDVRDIASFVAAVVDHSTTGVVNLAGTVTTARAMVDSVVGLADAAAHPWWVGEDFALHHGVRPWIEVPLWLPGDSPERLLMSVTNATAARSGLTLRPLAESIVDCLSWQAVRRSWSQRWLDATREQHLLQLWRR